MNLLRRLAVFVAAVLWFGVLGQGPTWAQNGNSYASTKSQIGYTIWRIDPAGTVSVHKYGISGSPTYSAEWGLQSKRAEYQTNSLNKANDGYSYNHTATPMENRPAAAAWEKQSVLKYANEHGWNSTANSWHLPPGNKRPGASGFYPIHK